MHDFDVTLPDGSIALEVTSAVDGATVQLSRAAFGSVGRETGGLLRAWRTTGS